MEKDRKQLSKELYEQIKDMVPEPHTVEFTERQLVRFDDFYECNRWYGVELSFPESQAYSLVTLTEGFNKICEQVSYIHRACLSYEMKMEKEYTISITKAVGIAMVITTRVCPVCKTEQEFYIDTDEFGESEAVCQNCKTKFDDIEPEYPIRRW